MAQRICKHEGLAAEIQEIQFNMRAYFPDNKKICDVNHRDRNGATALHQAALRRQSVAVSALILRPDLHLNAAFGDHRLTALHLAVRNAVRST